MSNFAAHPKYHALKKLSQLMQKNDNKHNKVRPFELNISTVQQNFVLHALKSAVKLLNELSLYPLEINMFSYSGANCCADRVSFFFFFFPEKAVMCSAPCVLQTNITEIRK